MRILFLGAGVMGAPIAVNLARAGHEVWLWNRNQQRPSYRQAIQGGCNACESLQDCEPIFDFIFTCLTDDKAVEEMLSDPSADLATLLAAGTAVIDMSTTGPGSAQKVAASLALRDVGFLDAPCSGGDIGAQQGNLTIMVGGDKALYQRALPLLKSIGQHIHHCGDAGAGQSVKLVNQLLAAVHMQALCEAIALSRHLQLDAEQVLEICGTGAAGSWALTNLGPKALAGDFEPGFSIGLIRKDIRLVRDALKGGALSLEALDVADQSFQRVADEPASFDIATQGMISGFE